MFFYIYQSNVIPVDLIMIKYYGTGIYGRGFWAKAAAKAVVVEADAFKETDVIYRALSSKGHHNDMLQTAELVHFGLTRLIVFYLIYIMSSQDLYVLKHLIYTRCIKHRRMQLHLY